MVHNLKISSKIPHSIYKTYNKLLKGQKIYHKYQIGGFSPASGRSKEELVFCFGFKSI